jgi:CheY-like chemotaxis protein
MVSEKSFAESSNKTPSKVILVAEDNPDDATIFELMFKRASLPQSLFFVEDGQKVIDWLSGSDGYSDRAKYPMPDQVLLDLKMPVKSGFEALEWIRRQEQLKHLPVIILSSSDDPRDMRRAEELGATSYFVKSPQLRDVLGYLRLN